MLAAADRNCRASLDGRAVQFTKDMFSKSLAFLLKQCEDYVYVSYIIRCHSLTAIIIQVEILFSSFQTKLCTVSNSWIDCSTAGCVGNFSTSTRHHKSHLQRFHYTKKQQFCLAPNYIQALVSWNQKQFN